eukprot:TRINITY_DN26898_c0_g1_i1.p1 TRINITY_DN26898_c0_g1~~TRINITY_DN26898_c0_g1_i1.p1  ORF type:complete len:637 (-),score=87.69 TRINITY_DN26898_c0_g1_i1:71-1981(-)
MLNLPWLQVCMGIVVVTSMFGVCRATVVVSMGSGGNIVWQGHKNLMRRDLNDAADTSSSTQKNARSLFENGIAGRIRFSSRSSANRTFQGPKPLPVLQDDRMSLAAKETELSRIITKLQAEFWMLKYFGSSRLHETAEDFDTAQTEYEQLVGHRHPHHSLLEDVPDGYLELGDTKSNKTGDAALAASDNRSSGLDAAPACLAKCPATAGQVTCQAAESDRWTNTQRCTCLSHWLHCAESLCDPSNLQADATFWEALRSSHLTDCVVGDTALHVAHADWTPEVTEETLEADVNGSREIGGQPKLQGRGSALTVKEINPPSSDCKVSHPRFLGDGNCDGGSYNTEECNYDGGDCCEADCRPSRHACSGPYDCKQVAKRVRLASNFACDTSELPAFQQFYDEMRERITIGDARLGASQCQVLTFDEHTDWAQAFNMGVVLKSYPTYLSGTAAADWGGPAMYIACTADIWPSTTRNDEFLGSLLAHEMGHIAGYDHPDFEVATFQSECKPLLSTYCSGHCMRWKEACITHLNFGSSSCGFAGLGCQLQCVKDDYCNSAPERFPICLGYEKVHSRGKGAAVSLHEHLRNAHGEGYNFYVHALFWATLVCSISSCGYCCYNRKRFSSSGQMSEDTASLRDSG